MKQALVCLLFSISLSASEYAEISKKIIRELDYIFQERAWSGANTFAKETRFVYRFKAISDHEIEISRSIDGVCLEEPFIIDLRDEYFVELEPDTKCNPAIIISHELDIIYLYVKDKCGHFGGFNLYERAMKATVLLKQHFDDANNLMKRK